MTAARDAAKTRRAMEKARARGRACAEPAGVMKPLVDRGACEAKADCEAVYPYGVFVIGPIEESEYRALPFFSRIKVWAHGKKTAYTPNADACHACGLCVEACPETAIRLVAV